MEDQYFNEGVTCFNQNKLVEAIEFYDKSIQINPNKPEIFEKKGLALLRLGEYRQAIEQFDAAIKINPKYQSSYYYKGISLRYLNQNEYAIEMFDKTVELDPQYFEAYANKAIIFQALEKYEDALQMINKVLDISPNTAGYYLIKGSLLSSLERFEEAIEAYKKSIELDDSNIQAYNNLGMALGSVGIFQEAIQCFNKCLDLNPGYAEAYNNKASQLITFGQSSSAIELLNICIELNPYYPDAYNNLGNAHRNLERYEKSLEMYDKAIQLDPTYSQAYIDKGITLKSIGKQEQAIKMFNMAILLNPKKASNAYYNKGLLLCELGRYKEGIEFYNEAIKLNSKFIFAYAKKAEQLISLGINQQAVESIQICYKLIKEGQTLGLTKEQIRQIQNTMNNLEKFEKKNAKILEEANKVGGSQNEKQNLQAAASKFTNLLKKLAEQQAAKKVVDLVDQSQTSHSLQSCQQDNQKNEINELEIEQILIYQQLMNKNLTLQEQILFFQTQCAKLEERMNAYEKQMKILQEDNIEIKQILQDAGTIKKAELNRELQQLQEDEEKSVFNYYQTFYWSSLNVFQTYRIISTNIVSGNYKSDLNEFLENNGDQIKEGMKNCLEAGKDICKGLISSVPVIGNIFSFIDKSIDVVMFAKQAYIDRKDQITFQNKVNAINQLIQAKFSTEEELSIQLASLAIKLSKTRKDKINYPDVGNEQQKSSSVFSWLKNQISNIEESHFKKTELYDLQDEGVKLALQDVILLISYISIFSKRIIQLQKKNIVDILVEVVDKQTDGLLALELDPQNQNNSDNATIDKTHSDKKDDLGNIERNTQRRSQNKANCACNIF